MCKNTFVFACHAFSISQVRKKLSAYWPSLADEIPLKLTSQKAPPAVSPFLYKLGLCLIKCHSS